MNFYRLVLSALFLLCAPVFAKAAPVDQWASTVIGYSSQWSGSGWSAEQALGAPDTFSYGDINTAWAPAPENGSLEFLTVGFATPVYTNGAMIRETYGNGFVRGISLLDTDGFYHQVWNGTDTSLTNTPFNFVANWSWTSYMVTGLRVDLDTNHNPFAWEEIDAIQLFGSTTPVPEPGTLAMLAAGLGIIALRARRS